MTTAYAYFNTSYSARTPYLTPVEYQNAPTAMDTSNLIPGGDANANAIALQETINRASSWIDQYTCGAWGTLCATVENENARVWGSYRGTLPIHPKYWPVIQVNSFSYTSVPGGLIAANANAASVDPSTSIVIYPQEFEVVQTGAINLGISTLSGLSGIQKRYEYDCQYQYVCGWPNTSLAASVAAGSTSITPMVVTGIYPNTQLTLYDLPNDEPLTVSSTYVAGASVVPLTSALQFNHSTSATVTNLPPAIKQAAILATTAFIKERGSGALVVQDIGELTRKETGFSQDAAGDWFQAMQLLDPFRTIYVGW